MEIKRSKKIHMIVEEEPKRPEPKVPIVEPIDQELFFKRIKANMIPGQSGQAFIESLKDSMRNKMSSEDIDKLLTKKANYGNKDFYGSQQTDYELSVIKTPSYDEIFKFGEFKEKSESEIGLTFEKLKKAIELNSPVTLSKGRQTGKTSRNMLFEEKMNGLEYNPETNVDWVATVTGRAVDRIKKGEMVAIAEARLENARRTPGNYWVTGDGRRIPIAEMTDTHLVNTIRYVFNKVDKKIRLLIQDAYQSLVGQQPWVTKLMFMTKLAEFENYGFCKDVFKRFPKLQTLIREAATRGLSLIKGDGKYS